jgi:hypothetical protein
VFQSTNKTMGKDPGVIAASAESNRTVRVDTKGDCDANFSLTDTPASVVPFRGFKPAP